MKNLYMSVIEVEGLPESRGFWSTTDPYVRVTIGDKSAQTSIKKRSGGRAIYHESFNLPLSSTDCKIEILDKNVIASDGLIADGLITVRPRDGYSYLGPVNMNDCKGTGLKPQIIIAVSIHDE